MKKTGFIIGIICIVSILLNTISVVAQEEIDWLADYTDEINAGSYSLKYNFTSVDNNACKLKIEELKTDKKGK
ncbi:MAG: hypothetical protein JSV22_04190, partial [Bacteroidales bacterium]